MGQTVTMVSPVGVRVATWNGRGICLADRQGRQEMHSAVQNLAQTVDILLLQEVHGSTSEIMSQLQLWLPHFAIVASGYEDTDGFSRTASGGVAIVIKPNLAVGPLSHLVFVPGRCHFVSLHTEGDVEMQIGNLHNFNVSKTAISNVGQHLKWIHGLEAANPQSVFSFF